MGKYMRKAKITGDVAVMEVSQSSLGVRTRAKTLALQRLLTNSGTTVSPPLLPSKPDSCYLELRSRRLEKPLSKMESKAQQLNPPAKITVEDSCVRNSCTSRLSNSGVRVSSVNSVSVDSASISYSKKEMACGNQSRVRQSEHETEDHFDLGFDAFFGENNLEFVGRDRSTRESTPCSMIRVPDTIGTPESSTRLENLTTINPTNINAMLGNVPTTHEVEAFFASVERQQQRLFIEKYNFDFANDIPLQGRYEWVQM